MEEIIFKGKLVTNKGYLYYFPFYFCYCNWQAAYTTYMYTGAVFYSQYRRSSGKGFLQNNSLK
jgi:hypothetical protein